MSLPVKVFCPVLNRPVRDWIQTGTKLARIAARRRFGLCSQGHIQCLRAFRKAAWRRPCEPSAIGSGWGRASLNARPLVVYGLFSTGTATGPGSLPNGPSPERIAPESAKGRFSLFVLARCCGRESASPQADRGILLTSGRSEALALIFMCQNGTAVPGPSRGGATADRRLIDGETRPSGLTPPASAPIDPPSEPGASCRPVPILIVELSPWPAVVS